MLSSAQQTAQFTAPSGKSFVFTSDIRYPRTGELLFSNDGTSLYTLVVRGISSRSEPGGTEEADLSFSNPHDGTNGRLHRSGDIIDYDGEHFIRQDATFDQSSIVPLPSQREPMYLCQAEDGTLFYVDSDKYNFSYESFMLYIGDGITMREVPIEDVERYRDGGTTYIRTSEKVFYWPTTIDTELVPQWGSQKLAKLNHEDYLIATSDTGVSITKK